MCGVPIRYFRLNNEIYIHQIFSSEDDRVELIDIDEKVILIFDSSMNIFDTSKQLIGRIGSENNCWYFESKEGIKIQGQSIHLAESHLDLEVEVSKWYLQKHQNTMEVL